MGFTLRPYQQEAVDAVVAKEITRDFLLEILTYNPLSGVFTWNSRSVGNHFKNKRAVGVFNALYSGSVAGAVVSSNKSATSYIAIKINGKSHKAHRLAFIYMTGDAPEEVDHIDHNGMNNKWTNLRPSDRKDNSKNIPKQKSNKTGVIGVNWHKAAKKWQARAVDKDGKRIDLGRFDNFEDAVEARKRHEISFGYYEHRD